MDRRKDRRREAVIVDLEEFLDLAELLRLADGGYVDSMCKKTLERVFADAKETHGLRYPHLRSLTRVSS